MPHDRPEQAEQLAKHSGALVVLKGAGTVATDGQQTYLNHSGNPGMATGGVGDVLTGCIAALLAVGLSCFAAAQLGIYIHGLAGDIAEQKKGQLSTIATDIIESLPEAFLKNE